MTQIGPVQVLAIGFGPEAEYKGQIMTELERLEGKGLIRVLDLLFLGTDLDAGELVALNYQGDELGALVGALLGFAFEGMDNPVITVVPDAGKESVGLTRADLEQMIGRSSPDAAIAVLLIEHVWARGLKQAIKDAGAMPLAEGFLSDEALGSIGAELEAVVELIEELEREEAPAGV